MDLHYHRVDTLERVLKLYYCITYNVNKFERGNNFEC